MKIIIIFNKRKNTKIYKLFHLASKNRQHNQNYNWQPYIYTLNVHEGLQYTNGVEYNESNSGSSINDVTPFRTIFDSPSLIVTHYITKALILSSQNPWPPSPLRPWRHLWTTPKLSFFSRSKSNKGLFLKFSLLFDISLFCFTWERWNWLRFSLFNLF